MSQSYLTNVLTDALMAGAHYNARGDFNKEYKNSWTDLRDPPLALQQKLLLWLDAKLEWI